MIINTSSSVTVNVVEYMTSPNEGIRDYKHVLLGHSECGSLHDFS